MSGDLDDEHVERLLHPTMGTDPPDDPLAAVLRAAATANRSGDLAGEDAAVATFRAGLADQPRGPHQTPRRGPALRGAFVAVLIALVITIAAVTAVRLTVLKPTHSPALHPPLTATRANIPAAGRHGINARALGRQAGDERSALE